MVRQIAISWFVLAIAFAFTAWLLPGVSINGGVFAVLWVTALFGFINAVLGTAIRILVLPLILITFGLFALLVNAGMVALTSGVSSHFNVDGFWPALWTAVMISAASTGLGLLLRELGMNAAP